MGEDLKSQLGRLVQLQSVDTRIYGLRQELEAVKNDPEVKRLESESRNRHKLLDALKAELRDAQQQAKYFQEEAKQLEENRAKVERRIYSGTLTNPRELEQYRVRSEQMAKSIREAEERQLDLMVKVEEIEPKVARVEEAAQETDTQLEEIQAKQAELISDLEARIEERLPDREEFLGDVSDKLLKVYEKTCEGHSGIGIAVVEDQVCGACHMSVPRGVYDEYRKMKRPVRCETCGRILAPVVRKATKE